MLGARGSLYPPVAGIRASRDKVTALQRTAGAMLVIEPDEPISRRRRCHGLGLCPGHAAAPGFTTMIEVRSDAGRPVEGAEVELIGQRWSAQGPTGRDGKVTLTVFGELPQNVEELIVRPRDRCRGLWQRQLRPSPPTRSTCWHCGCWRIWAWTSVPTWAPTWVSRLGAHRLGAHRPSRSTGCRPNTVAVVSRSRSSTGGCDELSAVAPDRARLRGRRRRRRDLVAGCGRTRHAVRRHHRGRDGRHEWHPRHCAGSRAARLRASDRSRIAATSPQRSTTASGLQSMSPASASPAPHGSTIVEQRIAAAKQGGLALVAPAGSNGGPVQFPPARATCWRWGDRSARHVPARQSAGRARRIGARGRAVRAGVRAAGLELDLCAPGVAVMVCQAPDAMRCATAPRLPPLTWRP